MLDLTARHPIWRMPPWVAERVRTALGEGWDVVEVGTLADSDGDGAGSADAGRAAEGAEVYVGFGVPRPVLDAARGTLRWVHTAAAGVGGAVRLLQGTDVRTTNSAGVHAEPMADWALAAILHFARGLDIVVRAQADRRWDKEAFTDGRRRFPELSQLAIGIVGLGGIGRAVARRAVALGCMVRGVRRHAERAVPGVLEVRGPEGLLEVARVSDVVVVATPGTSATANLIDASVFAALPPGAVLVSLSRGRCVDEAALLAALEGGRLRGAALDVFGEEPLPSAHPFWAHPRVLVSPHVSSVSDRFWEREAELLVDNVSRYVTGRALRNLVDPKAGY